jgi:hypothetical protein
MKTSANIALGARGINMDQPRSGVQHWPTAFPQRAVISPFDGEQLNHKDVRLMADKQESRVNGPIL